MKNENREAAYKYIFKDRIPDAAALLKRHFAFCARGGIRRKEYGLNTLS